jgi:hypothetical protein
VKKQICQLVRIVEFTFTLNLGATKYPLLVKKPRSTASAAFSRLSSYGS